VFIVIIIIVVVVVVVKCYIWSIALYGSENWALRKICQKYLESFEMCWRRMEEKIGWADRVRNVCYIELGRRGIYPTCNEKEGSLTGLGTFCV